MKDDSDDRGRMRDDVVWEGLRKETSSGYLISV
jgi:hypothetical protein